MILIVGQKSRQLILTHPRKISITQLMLTQTHCCYTLRNCNFERLSRKWPRYFQQPSQNELELFLKKHLVFGCKCKKKSSALNHKTVVHEKRKLLQKQFNPNVFTITQWRRKLPILNIALLTFQLTDRPNFSLGK